MLVPSTSDAVASHFLLAYSAQSGTWIAFNIASQQEQQTSGRLVSLGLPPKTQHAVRGKFVEGELGLAGSFAPLLAPGGRLSSCFQVGKLLAGSLCEFLPCRPRSRLRRWEASTPTSRTFFCFSDCYVFSDALFSFYICSHNKAEKVKFSE